MVWSLSRALSRLQPDACALLVALNEQVWQVSDPASGRDGFRRRCRAVVLVGSASPPGLIRSAPSPAARHRYQPHVRDVVLTHATLRVAEAGSGPPLLLVNGIGAGFQTWWPLARRLSQSRRLIMFDAPGAGGSPQLRWPEWMPGLARLVVELCDALGETQVDVLGYSWGGVLAQQLAHDAPQRVRRLALASTTPGLGGRLPSPAVLALVSSPLPYLSRTYLTRIAPLVYGGEWRRGGATAPRELARWLEHSPNLIGMSSSCTRSAGGRACRGCTMSPRRPSCSAARGTRSSRSRTLTCSLARFPARGSS
jgi:hypothetical protein